MVTKINQPDAPLDFIKRCVRELRIYWTYHVNMRLRERLITRPEIIQSVERYEIIDSYPSDKHLPSYLVWTRHEDDVLHILFAADVENGNVRVITAYRPAPEEWGADFKRRR